MVDVIDGIHAPIDMYRANDTLPTGLPKDRATDAEDAMQEDFPNAHRQLVNWSLVPEKTSKVRLHYSMNYKKINNGGSSIERKYRPTSLYRE